MFYIFIVLLVIQMYTFVKTHWTIHLKKKIFILYELYHKTFDFKKVIMANLLFLGLCKYRSVTPKKYAVEIGRQPV